LFWLGTTYEGHFYNGMMHGYGIKIEPFKVSKKQEKDLDIINDIKEKPNENFQINEEKKGDLLENKTIEEAFYEGEFCFGYKHGIGRYYYKKGSYCYGEWRFDKSIGHGNFFLIFYFFKLKKFCFIFLMKTNGNYHFSIQMRRKLF